MCVITNFSQLFCILIRIPFIRYLHAVEMSRKRQGSQVRSRKSQGEVREVKGESGKPRKSQGRVREAGKVFGDRVRFTALLLSVELF